MTTCGWEIVPIMVVGGGVVGYSRGGNGYVRMAKVVMVEIRWQWLWLGLGSGLVMTLMSVV